MEELTVQETSETNTEPCFRLELPGELRNEIFSLALYYPNGVAIDCVAQKLSTPHPLALLATCKQIRKEKKTNINQKPMVGDEDAAAPH